MLLFVLLACNRREPYYPPVDTDEDTTPTDTDTDTPDTDPPDTDTPDTTGNIWDDPEWWTEPGPFAELIDLKKAPTTPHWEAWMTTSKDLKSWTRGVPFAFNISSLDVLVIEDKGVIVGASISPDQRLDIKVPFEHFFMFTTTDLESWGTHQIEIEDAAEPMIIDPSVHWTPDGRLRLVYFGSGLDVDPEKLPDDYPNPHAVFEGWWNGDHFIQESDTPLLEADYVVDPSGCYDGDRLYMMGTRRYEELYFVYRDSEDDDFTPIYEEGGWGGVQVPYCFDQGDTPVFIAQYGGGQGAPYMRTFDEKGLLGDPEPIFTLDEVGYDGCTTPVMGLYNGTYFMICSTWIE